MGAERIVEVPQIQIMEVEKEVVLPATTVTGSPVTTLMGSQRVYSEPVATNIMSSASPTTLTYGASASAMSAPYQMVGQTTLNNQTVTYPTSFQATTSSPTMTYTTASTVQTGMSSAGATFDMLDRNHDGVITRQE